MSVVVRGKSNGNAKTNLENPCSQFKSGYPYTQRHVAMISVSYDRVLRKSTQLGNEVCRRYHESKAVCPPNLHLGLFTTAAVDNTDHNPSSTTAKNSFHGTGISLFQHVSADSPGTVQERIKTSLYLGWLFTGINRHVPLLCPS